MGTHAASRLPSFPSRGFHAYFVTCGAGHRHARFADAACVHDVTRQLLHHAESHEFEVSAYCFMPDHVHVVLETTSPRSDLRRLMNAWKQHTGYAHARATGSKLWQSGYYDHVLRNDDSRLAVIASLLSNPLRAGLVSDLRRYPFWGSGVWERDQLLEAVQHLLTDRRHR